MSELSLYPRVGKRLFDLLGAILGLLFIWPLLLLVALAVKITSSGPVFFRQTRVGRFGRHFCIFKFRSMRTDGDAGSQITVFGDPRITPLGAWLRKTKIDELPQLINIVQGQMSLVGPRPEVPKFTVHYNSEQLKVLSARPGMTGLSADIYEEEILAQATDTESFYIEKVMPAKLATDLVYCRRITFSTDIHILLATFAKLSTRIYQPHRALGQSTRTSLTKSSEQSTN